MKTRSILIALALGATPLLLEAQTPNPPASGQRPPPPASTRGSSEGRRGDRPADNEALTPAQQAQAKSILSKFDPRNLTADQAKAIHQAFREAGLRGGPAMSDTLKAAGFDPDTLRDLAPPAAPREGDGPGDDGARKPRVQGTDPRPEPPDRNPGGAGQYSIEQAVSDRAQLNTIAFDGLAFLTGDLGGNTFLPPGKAADFFGFQYMRDVDSNELGHNTSFVPRAANNVLQVLSTEQKAQLIALAKEQEALLADLAYKRFPLVKAFCRLLEGDLPAGTTGLDRAAVMKYTRQVFEVDGLLSYRRAEVLGAIVRSLDTQQQEYLGRMAFNNSATWPELPDQVDKRSLSHAAHVAVMTYASELFSWYAGSVDADVYFCPERHATYFGSFYMKDIPAMGNANFSISTSLTGDSGEAFLAALTDTQRPRITGLVDLQRKDLEEIVTVRRAISIELRRFMKEGTIDKAKVLDLARRYGELDGEISYWYATRFSEVGKTLSAEQKQTLLKLRNLDSRYVCKGAYLYSQAIEMPVIPNTDFLFGASTPPPSSPSPAPTTTEIPPASEGTFALRSPAVPKGGRLPQEYTGDGDGATPPLEWSAPPAGTKAYAVIMHHLDPEGRTKWYRTLYNIGPDVRSLPANAQGVGTVGNNSVDGRIGYAPPHSKGPGEKTYTLTLYALSAPLQIAVPPSQVSREVLIAAMKGKILATSELNVTYARGETRAGPSEDPRSAEPALAGKAHEPK